MLRTMVSERAREHFRRIAEAEAELNAESVRHDAQQSPGDNIARGLELSEFAAAFGADLEGPDKVSPATLWQMRKRQAPTQR